MESVTSGRRQPDQRDPWRRGRNGLAQLVLFVSVVTVAVLAHRLGRPAEATQRAVWLGGCGLLVLASVCAVLVMVFAFHRTRSGWFTLASVLLCVAGFTLMLGYAFATDPGPPS